ncbi:MAG: ABC transporter permease, partial [Planctomycetes bacterium]|nr:ABC transporter permease [Planctomycetota bacterium]
MTGVWHDVRHGLRMLGRSPLATEAVVFALAASIGANTVLFSVIDEALLRPLPYPQARRLVTVWESWLDKGFSRLPVLPTDFLEWQTQAGLFDELAAFKSAAFNLAGTDEPERLRAARVTPSFLAALGVGPAIGRRCVPEDDNPNAERVVLLADEVWRRRFGADTAVVGRHIRLDGVSHTIVGIMPREFRFALDWSLSGLTLLAVDLWVPLALTPEEQDAGFDLMVVGRLRHDVSVAMARTRLEAIAEALERRDPKRKGIGLAVVPLQDVIRTAQSALISSRPRALSGIPVRRSKSATDANGARSR